MTRGSLNSHESSTTMNVLSLQALWSHECVTGGRVVLPDDCDCNRVQKQSQYKDILTSSTTANESSTRVFIIYKALIKARLECGSSHDALFPIRSFCL